MSIPSQQSEPKKTADSGGSLTGWLRRSLTERKTVFVLASSTIAAMVAAMYLPADSLLSASQIAPSGGSEAGGAQASDETGGFEIVPRGRDAGGRSVSMRRPAGPQTPTRPTTAVPADGASSVARRAVLQNPVFSEPGKDAERFAEPPQAVEHQQPRTEALQQPQSPPVRPQARHGHSGISRPPAGYNYVDAAGITSLPYAGHSRNPGSLTSGGMTPASNRATSVTAVANSGTANTVPANTAFANTSFSHTVAAGTVTGTPTSAGSMATSSSTATATTSVDGDPPQDPGLSDPSASVPGLADGPLNFQQPATPVPAVPFMAPGFSGDAVRQSGPGSLAGPGIPADPVAPPRTEFFSPPPLESETIAEPSRVPIGSGAPFSGQVSSTPAFGHSFRGPAPGTSGFRGNVEADAPGWIDPYRNRTDLQPTGVEPTPTPLPSVSMPPGYSAWWDSLVQQRAGIAPRSMPVDVTSLVQQALVHSPQVQVLQADPEVQLQVVQVEEAAFDWKAFLEANYNDLNDPVGNTLTTGNNSKRFEDNLVNSNGGLRRRTEAGGELEVSQKLGHQYNNSVFLVPNPQSTSRMELSFRQPLLGRAGTVYNQNQIVLARISANLSSDETLQEIQGHLFRVAEVYWKLYRARAEFFQRQKLLASAQGVLTTLEGRNEVDTIPRQILRARAAVARAESRMQRAVTDIRNAESQLRLLVNDPAMLNSGPIEFTPTEMPATIPSPTGLRESLQEALINRPDISQAIRQMRASGVRLGVSKNEMLPKLDFIVTTYVAGLQNNAQIADSFGDQFSQGRPGYTVGMEFEVPLGNRAAKARVEQRQWELRRAIGGFRATVETSLTEVEIACREVDTSWRELLGKYEAMVAAQNEVHYLQDRFEVLPAVEESSMLLLENLLDGYERLADEESAFSQAQANYALSIIQLRRTTGVLMRTRYDAPQLQPTETEYMTSRADQAASAVEARASRLANLRNEETVSDIQSAPASWSDPVGQRPAADSSRMAAPMPRREPATATPRTQQHQQTSGGQSFGGHSFGKGN